MSLNSLLLTDFYKDNSFITISEGITHLTSYLTPSGQDYLELMKL